MALWVQRDVEISRKQAGVQGGQKLWLPTALVVDADSRVAHGLIRLWEVDENDGRKGGFAGR